MSKYLIKIFLVLPLIFLQSCGYQPLLTDKYQNFSVNNFIITGDKKLGQELGNNFTKIEGSKNNLSFNINSTKKRTISNKSSTGSAIEYNIDINIALIVKSEPSGVEIFKNSFSENRTYKASNLHIDSLNREKKIIRDLIKTIAEKIKIQLHLIYRDE
tara:strand:- start:124 stop:597 length:474 start_codon:yes stop_codon:yes gene_type:complete